MATLSDKNEIKSAVLHVLANTENDLSPSEIADILSIKTGLVSRALFEAKRDKPPMVDVSSENKNKFAFIGDETMLDPLPDGVNITLGGGKSAGKPAAKGGQSKASDSKGVLGEVEGSVLRLFHDRNKMARSALHEKLGKSYGYSDLDSVIDGLVEAGYFTKTAMEEFDEDILDLTKKGQDVVSSLPGSVESPAEKPAEKAPATRRKSPGRPSGKRDFALLRRKMLEFIEESGDVSKSHVAKSLSSELENFGRSTIGKEFLKLIDEGVLEVSLDDTGSQKPGLYRVAKSTKAVEPAQAAPAETAPEASVSDVALPKQEERSRTASKVPEKSDAEGIVESSPINSAKIVSLKKDLQRVVGEDVPGLSSEIGGLFSRVLEYVEELEHRVERLRAISKDVIDRI